MVSYVLAVIVSALLILADQLTKYWITAQLPLNGSLPFIPGVMDFWYIHNEGGAWGFLEGYTWILLSVTILVILVCLAMLIKFGAKSKVLFWAVSLVLAGGIGNMIDRLFRGGKVVDFLHVTFINFPVFNVADCAIVIGAGLLMVYFINDLIRESRKGQN